MKRRYLVSATATVGVSFEVVVDIPDDYEGNEADYVSDELMDDSSPQLEVFVGDHSGQMLGVTGAVAGTVRWHTEGCYPEAADIEPVGPKR